MNDLTGPDVLFIAGAAIVFLTFVAWVSYAVGGEGGILLCLRNREVVAQRTFVGDIGGKVIFLSKEQRLRLSLVPMGYGQPVSYEYDGIATEKGYYLLSIRNGRVTKAIYLPDWKEELS